MTLVAATTLVGTGTAQATLPGSNGRIAFSYFSTDFTFSDIFTVNPDGTAVVNVTNSPGIDAHPAWSPDGSKIAFASDRDGDYDIYVMDADGSNVVNLSNTSPGWDEFPTWSPDGTAIAYSSIGIGIVVADASTGAVLRTLGTASDFYPDWGANDRIAFTSFRDGNAELYAMDADGSNSTRLTTTPSRDEYMPSWAPNVSRISFWAIESGSGGTWMMDENGANAVLLASGGGSSWSPDGTRIVYGWGDVGGVTTMNADGTDHVAVHGGFGSQIPDRPAWGTAPLVPPPPPPLNDDIDAAISIDTLPFTDGPLDTSTATTDTAPPDPDCYGAGPTVWYSFTPSSDAVVELNTQGSDYDTTLSVYTRSSKGALTQLACNDDHYSLQSRIRLPMRAGTTYLVMVGSYAGYSSGTLLFNVFETSFAVGLVVTGASVDTTTGVATVSGVVSCSQDAFVQFLNGTLRQRIGRRGVVEATFWASEFDCHAPETTWSAQTYSSGEMIVAGNATLHDVSTWACMPFLEECDGEYLQGPISLRLRRR